MQVTMRTGTGELSFEIDMIRTVGGQFTFDPQNIRITFSSSGMSRFRRNIVSVSRRALSPFPTPVPGVTPVGQVGSVINEIQSEIDTLSITSDELEFRGVGREGGPIPPERATGSKSVSFPTVKVPAFEGSSLVQSLEQKSGIGDIQDVIGELPQVSVTVTGSPTGLAGSISRLTRQQFEVQFAIPPSIFIEQVDISQLGCEDVYSNIDSRLSQLEPEPPAVQNFADDFDVLRDIRDEVVSTTGSGSLRSLIDSPDPSQILAGDISQRRLQRFEERFRQTEPDFDRIIGRIRSQIDSIERDLSETRGTPCFDDFQNRINRIDIPDQREVDRYQILREQLSELFDIEIDLGLTDCINRTFDLTRRIGTDSDVSGSEINRRLDNIQSDIRSVERDAGRLRNLSELSQSDVRDILSDVREIQDALDDGTVVQQIQAIPVADPGGCQQQFMSRVRLLRNRIDGVDIPTIESPDLSCRDVPSSIRSAVAGLEDRAQSFEDARPAARTQNRFSNILSDIRDTRRRVRSEVSDQNPCKEQLLSRLDEAESIVRQEGPARRENLPCELQFRDIDRQLSNFEDQVLDTNPPVDPDTFERFASRAQNIIDQVESEVPLDSRCRRDFTQRIEGALDRVGDIGARTRVAREFTDEEIERRRQTIEELESRLQEIGDIRSFV